jgi:cytochrome c6
VQSMLVKIVKMLLLAIALSITLPLLGFVHSTAWAADLESGAQVFELHCAGCHINGGNIVRRGKNLKLKTLHRNGMDSVEAIAEIVTNGKNNMSAYGDRLTSEQIQAVAAYVLEQAQTEWRSP